MSSSGYLDSLFRPESIVLIGASHTEDKLGGIVLKNLLSYKHTLYPVNPKYPSLMGVKTYPSLPAVFEGRRIPVDLTIILRPASEVPGILKELRQRTKTAVIVSAGFSESGQTALQDEVKAIGYEAGIRLLGPNCLGVYNAHERLDTFFISSKRLKRPKKGNVAVLSQSGAVLTSLFEAIRASNTGVSKAAGYGNAVDIDVPELYDYLSGDPSTDIVISYIESVGDGRRFIEAAKALSGRKSLLILKSGKGTSGQAAAFSHTGRLAGSYEVFNSILAQFGIKEASDFDSLVDAAKALSYQRPSRGNRVCIITDGGGSGVLASDECMRQRLDVAQVPEERVRKLRELFPPFYGMNNPIDLTAQVKDADYAFVLEALKDDYDGFLIIALTTVTGVTAGLANLVRDFRVKYNKPVVLYTDINSISRHLIALSEKAGIPAFPSPERAARGLRALLE